MRRSKKTLSSAQRQVLKKGQVVFATRGARAMLNGIMFHLLEATKVDTAISSLQQAIKQLDDLDLIIINTHYSAFKE
jgi:hypothetical protein